MTSFKLAAAAFLLSLGACSPYSPDFTSDPFECGDTAPECPDGYTCGSDSLCVKGGGGGGSGSGGFMCADDSALEPNNSIGTAYNTPVATQRATLDLTGLAICPAGDLDFYKVTTTAADQTLTATMTYSEGEAILNVQILDTQGNTLANGSGSSNVLTATHSLPNSGAAYYVEVSSSQSGGENNYSLNLAVQ